jgi:hypothetical protein
MIFVFARPQTVVIRVRRNYHQPDVNESGKMTSNGTRPLGNCPIILTAPPPLSPNPKEAIRICTDFNMDPDPRILTDPDPALFFSDFQYAN